MSLIAERHPRLGQLLRLWRSRCAGEALPVAATLDASALADLAPMTVLLTRGGDGADRLTIATSGAEVDALFGGALAGAPVGRLASVRGDAGQEAWTAIETARPVALEDDVRVGDRRTRVARLYLPLANPDGSADGVLCGLVAAR